MRQEDEEREFQARLLALAGVGPAGVAAGGGDGAADDGGGDAEGGDAGNEGYLTEDDADPDELTYEEVGHWGQVLLLVCVVVGRRVRLCGGDGTAESSTA